MKLSNGASLVQTRSQMLVWCLGNIIGLLALGHYFKQYLNAKWSLRSNHYVEMLVGNPSTKNRHTMKN